MVVFVVATYGEGEPTDNARDFYEWMKKDHDPKMLSNLKYCVNFMKMVLIIILGFWIRKYSIQNLSSYGNLL